MLDVNMLFRGVVHVDVVTVYQSCAVSASVIFHRRCASLDQFDTTVSVVQPISGNPH